MGIYKELHIDYQDITEAEADRLIANKPSREFGVPYHLQDNAEKQIWRKIGSVDYELADELTNEYPYEAALICIERGQLPLDNYEWQQLVVRLAYNAISDTEEFESCIAHSRFSADDVQRMLDLAASQVLKHPNFNLAGFEQLTPQ